MLREIASELGAALVAEKCPIPVVLRDRNTPGAYTPERIVLEHDEDGGDSFGAPKSHRYNPKHAFTCSMGVKATIYTKEPLANAAEFEHRRRAEKIRDQVLAGLRKIAGTRKNAFVPKSGRFVVPPALADSASRAGAAYELKFTFDRAVKHTKWDGSAKPVAVLAKVSMSGNPTLTFADAGASGDTITRSAGSWITDGFAVGMRVRVRGTTSNNVTDALITALTATVVTFGASPALVAEVVTGAKVTAGGVLTTGLVALNDDDGNLATAPAGAEAF